MQASSLLILIVGLSFIAYVTGRARAQQRRSSVRLPALPAHYGYLTAMWFFLAFRGGHGFTQ